MTPVSIVSYVTKKVQVDGVGEAGACPKVDGLFMTKQHRSDIRAAKSFAGRDWTTTPDSAPLSDFIQSCR